MPLFKKIILLLGIVFGAGELSAQNRGTGQQAPAQAPQVREVGGILKDSLNKAGVSGAVVTLISPQDSLTTTTNASGMFVFKEVKATEFIIQTRSLGYQSYSQKVSFPNTSGSLVLDPLILKQGSNVLEAVEIKATGVVHKTDTVEYGAADYKVKANASMEDLLKKMEGIEVDKDGKVTAQGTAVTRARVNGRNVAGTDMANLLRDLPAEVAEKIQVVDDYGDQAELTGIKDGEPQKVLNIVTRRDRSVKTTGTLGAMKGTDAGYNINISGTRQNGNQNVTFRSSFNNAVTGRAGNQNGGNQGGAGNIGINQRGSGMLSFSDDLSKKIRVNGNYNFNFGNNNSTNISTGQRFLKTLGSDEVDTVFLATNGGSDNHNSTHSFEGRLDHKINKTTQMNSNVNFNINRSENTSSSVVNSTGGLYQDQNMSNGTSNSTPSFNISTNIAHTFGKLSNASLQLSVGNSGNSRDQSARNRLFYYNPASLAHELLKDSILNRLINTDNETVNYRASGSFSRSLNAKSRLEFTGQMNYRGYDNNQIVNDVTNGDLPVRIDRLSKIFNYSVTETRMTLNYRYGARATKFNYSLGLGVVPVVLRGESQTLGTSTERKSFNIIPVTRIEYKWNNQKRVNLNYNGNPREPSFDQIQDVPDETNPNNVIIGNPYLKTSFSHNINGSYRNSIPKKKLNMGLNLSSSFVQGQVISNRIQLTDVYSSVKSETRFLNKSGNYNHRLNYDITKRFKHKKSDYSLSLNGAALNGYSISMYNGEENFRRNWAFQERVALQLSPLEWLDVNPYVAYNFTKNNYSLPVSNDSYTKAWSLNLSGRIDFMPRFYLRYDLSKDYINGINASSNAKPFIVNTFLTKEFLKNRRASMTINAFDLLKQNSFNNRTVSDNGITNVKTNSNSRYFTVNLQWKPTVYSGGSKKTSGARKEDGSFVIDK